VHGEVLDQRTERQCRKEAETADDNDRAGKLGSPTPSGEYRFKAPDKSGLTLLLPGQKERPMTLDRDRVLRGGETTESQPANAADCARTSRNSLNLD
jgi:hypothetical protein